MALQSGTRLGPYEILSPLGAGGMGEVYRARDTRLDRDVAIKVLPPGAADRADLRERFEREARAVSSLSHPHICALYDVGRHGGTDYLVMEFIEGDTLAWRLEKGPMPTSELLRVAIQISDALDAAHRHGVVHRDLKPANIMLTKSGSKLLDFGLAKTHPPGAAGGSPLGGMQTERLDLTAEGAILGTVQYMAPEQLEGKEADARTDIFAFGAVLYEMATGKKAFEGKSQASLIAAILTADPVPVTQMQPLTPPALDRVVRRALAKDPEDRWQTARDLRSELEWIAEGGSQPGSSVSPAAAVRPRWRGRAGWGVAVLMTAALGAVLPLAVSHLSREPRPERVLRFALPPPEKSSFGESFALSPDGLSLTFVAFSSGKPSLWIRSLDSLEARRLAGTDNASLPFWSPEGGSIGFFADNKLKKVDVGTGAVQILCDSLGGRGGTWSADGGIVFSPSFASPLFSVAPRGGAMTQVTTVDRSKNETSHRFPHFLPDGRHFLFLARAGTREETRLHVASLGSHENVELLSGVSSAVYVAPGFLLYVKQQRLIAHPFDASRLRFTGEPIQVATPVQQFGEAGPTGYGAFSVSGSGLLACMSGYSLKTQLAWFDRRGSHLGDVGPPGNYSEPTLSPDGRRLAVSKFDPEGSGTDIWTLDLARGAFSRLTFESSQNLAPIWSPAADRIVFASARTGFYGLYWKLASGVGAEELLLESLTDKWPDDWSPDGRFIVYEDSAPDTGADLWALPVSADRTPRPLIRTRFMELHAAISPDGRWIAYTSDESGRSEIYVQTIPPAGGKWQISTEGGDHATWRRDGRELLYVSPDRDLMAVSLGAGPDFEPGIPAKLFRLNAPSAAFTSSKADYAVAADGRRILVNTLVEEGTSSPITLVVDWLAGVGK